VGTNYYAQPPACPCCERRGAARHLGKHSPGWAFLFHGNRGASAGPRITTAAEWDGELDRLLAAGWTLIDEDRRPACPAELRARIDATRHGRAHVRESQYRNPAHAHRDCWLDGDGNNFCDGRFA
jgi:hypothetical protein